MYLTAVSNLTGFSLKFWILAQPHLAKKLKCFINPISHGQGHVLYDLAFLCRITQKNFKLNKSKNISIPGAVSCESVLFKVFLI
jgi:hypothetical protein